MEVCAAAAAVAGQQPALPGDQPQPEANEWGALVPAALQHLTQLRQLRLECHDLKYTGVGRSPGSLQQLRELDIEESSWWINPD